jgi:hypothetical protein
MPALTNNTPGQHERYHTTPNGILGNEAIIFSGSLGKTSTELCLGQYSSYHARRPWRTLASHEALA